MKVRDLAGRAWAWGCHQAETSVLEIRPRVSLASGSVLVLLTLFLPVAYEACGPARTGYQFIRGQGDWPTWMGLLSDRFGRPFYVVSLVWASLTLLAVLASIAKPSLQARGRLATCLYGFAVTLSFLLLVDLFPICSFLKPEFSVGSRSVALGDLILIVCGLAGFVLSLRLGDVWKRAGPLPRVFSTVGLSFIVIYFALNLLEEGWLQGMSVPEYLSTPGLLFFCAPIAAWYSLGLSRRGDRRAAWLAVRPRIAAFYVAVAVANGGALLAIVQQGVWGFPLFVAGIHLITIGHMQLARQPASAPTGEGVGIPSG